MSRERVATSEYGYMDLCLNCHCIHLRYKNFIWDFPQSELENMEKFLYDMIYYTQVLPGDDHSFVIDKEGSAIKAVVTITEARELMALTREAQQELALREMKNWLE